MQSAPHARYKLDSDYNAASVCVSGALVHGQGTHRVIPAGEVDVTDADRGEGGDSKRVVRVHNLRVQEPKLRQSVIVISTVRVMSMSY